MRLSKISSVTWPPPASSAQWPALAAAATIFASTVVGVMPASRIGERPVSRVNLVDSLTDPSGRVTADAESADHRCGDAGDGVAGSEIDDPLRACLVQAFDLTNPVDGLGEDRLGEVMQQVRIDAQFRRPSVDHVDAVGEPRGVEADLDLHPRELRAEDRAAAQLVLA